MASSISAEEWELVSALQVEPEYLDHRDPWPYTHASFTVHKDALSLTFAVAPAYRDVRIVLSHLGQTLYELTATAVVDVLHRREGGRELIDVVLNARDRLTLSAHPTISLQHDAAGDE